MADDGPWVLLVCFRGPCGPDGGFESKVVVQGPNQQTRELLTRAGEALVTVFRDAETTTLAALADQRKGERTVIRFGAGQGQPPGGEA